MQFLFSNKKLLCVAIPSLVLLSMMLTSCGTTRPYVYMQGQFDTTKLSQLKVIDPVIQKGDLLQIIVYSDDPEATKIYNQPLISGQTSSGSNTTTSGAVEGGAGSSLGGSPTTPGYLVDENGY